MAIIGIGMTAAAPAAHAAVGDVTGAGVCTGGAVASVKLSPDLKKKATKYTLNFSFPRETKKWNYAISDNGTAIAAGQRDLRAPAFGFNISGSRVGAAGHKISATLVDIQGRNSCTVEATV